MHRRWHALLALCLLGLAAFWLQTLWDMASPPVFMSPWGALHESDPQPPTVASP